MSSISSGSRGACSSLTAHSELGVRQGGAASTGTLLRDAGDEGPEEAAESVVVPLQDPDHLLRGDGRNVLDADVVVGDEGDVDAAQLQLQGQDHLGVLRHADDVPSLCSVEGALGPRREKGTLTQETCP